MKNIEGFITLHRKLTEWEWYDDIPTKTLFLHLLLTVNYKDKKWRGIDIARGSILTGVPTLSEQTNLSQMQVRRALANLEKTGEVNRQTTSQYSIITLNKYNHYQARNSQTTVEQQTDNIQATDGQQLLKERNNENNENNNISKFLRTDKFNEWWKSYPKKVCLSDAIEFWNEIIQDNEEIVEKINTAMKWQKISGCLQEVQFSPKPHIYLKDKRWEDEKVDQASQKSNLSEEILTSSEYKRILRWCENWENFKNPKKFVDNLFKKFSMKIMKKALAAVNTDPNASPFRLKELAEHFMKEQK